MSTLAGLLLLAGLLCCHQGLSFSLLQDVLLPAWCLIKECTARHQVHPCLLKYAAC